MAMPENPANLTKTDSGFDSEVFQLVCDLSVSTFDAECIRLIDPEQTKRIESFFLDFYYTYRLHTLFISKNIQELSTRVMENERVREFILNFADVLSIYLCTEEMIESITKTIANNISRNKPISGDQHFSLIPQPIQVTIDVDRATLHSCLKDNFWLLCLVILFLVLPRTHLFQATLTLDRPFKASK